MLWVYHGKIKYEFTFNKTKIHKRTQWTAKDERKINERRENQNRESALNGSCVFMYLFIEKLPERLLMYTENDHETTSNILQSSTEKKPSSPETNKAI